MHNCIRLGHDKSLLHMPYALVVVLVVVVVFVVWLYNNAVGQTAPNFVLS